MTYKLILIEDDPIFTFLLEKAIKKANLNGRTTAFTNGSTAIEFLKKDYNEEENFVLFLDLNMPLMNGWQFMELFKTFADPANCSVFILTSSKNQMDIDILMENPLVADFISKPISELTMEKIKEMIDAKFGG
ncbi:MAG: response regulator [Maribacter sp.]